MRRVTISMDEENNAMIRTLQGDMIAKIKEKLSFSDTVNLMLYIAGESWDKCKNEEVFKNAFMKFANARLGNVKYKDEILRALEETFDKYARELSDQDEGED